MLPVEHGWISRLKKYHDLQICTQPTCRGILGDGIRKKIFSNRKYFFSNLQTSKKNLYLEVCKFEKKLLPVVKYICSEYHRLEYCNMLVICKCEGHSIFLSEISSRGG